MKTNNLRVENLLRDLLGSWTEKCCDNYLTSISLHEQNMT